MIQEQSSLKDLLFFHQIMAACKNSANPNGPVTRSRIKPSFFICYTLERLWPLPQPKRLRCDIVHGHLGVRRSPRVRSSPRVSNSPPCHSKLSFVPSPFWLIISPPLTIKKKHTHSDVGASNSSTLEVGNLFEATFCRFEPFRLVVGGSSTDGSFSIDY